MLVLSKEFFSLLGVVHNDPFSVDIGSKKQFLRSFTNFSGTAGLQHKLLILIVPLTYFIGNHTKKAKWVWSLGPNLGQISSDVVKKNKETGISMVFFHILHEIYIYNQKGSGYRNT